MCKSAVVAKMRLSCLFPLSFSSLSLLWYVVHPTLASKSSGPPYQKQGVPLTYMTTPTQTFTHLPVSQDV